MIRNVLGFLGGLAGLLAGGAIYLVFALGVSALSLTVTLSVVYIFLAMAGIVPPQDFVPLVPYL